MLQNKSYDFSQPTRQSGVAILLILLKSLRNLARTFWPLLLVMVFNRRNKNDQWEQYTLIAVVIISVISVFSSIVSFFRYYFRLSPGELIIEEGLINRKKTIIPFDRIQTINIEQGIIHKMFQVVQLKIDTAGSKGEEVSIQALDGAMAQALKDQIFAVGASHADLPQDTKLAEDRPVARELVHLTVGDMLKVGVSQNHLQTAGVVLAFLIGFFDDIDELFNLNILDTIETWVGDGTLSIWLTFTMIIPVFILISFVVSLIRTVFKYYEQRVWLSVEGLKLEAGLLTRLTTYIKPTKVQWLYWSQNPIYRAFNLHELKIKQAAGTLQDLKRTIEIPGCYHHQVETIKKEIFAEHWFEPIRTLVIHPSMGQRYFLIYGTITAALTFLLVVSQSWLAGLFLGLAAWALSFFYWRAYQRSWRCHINDEALLCAYGVWDHRHLILPFYKVQGIRLKQSPYQRSHDLATIQMDTASGQVTIPYLQLKDARDLTNLLLFKVESTNRSWM